MIEVIRMVHVALCEIEFLDMYCGRDHQLEQCMARDMIQGGGWGG